jgi:hypothetical protein
MQQEGFSPHEQEFFERYQPVMQRLGTQFLGLDTIPETPTRHLMDGVIWEVSKAAEEKAVSLLAQSVAATLEALHAEHVPFIVCVGIAVEKTAGFHLIDDGGAIQGPPVTSPHAGSEREPLPIVIIPTSTAKGLWYLV